MASRSLDDLAEPVRALVPKFVSACRAVGVDVLIYCTLRSNEEQDALYAIGRHLPGAIKTDCRGGESNHNPDKQGKAWAFDAVPIVHGSLGWNNQEQLRKMGEAGEAVGLKWAGRWAGRLRESVHFELDRGEYGST